MKAIVIDAAPDYTINESGQIFSTVSNRYILYRGTTAALQNNGQQIRVNVKNLLEKYFNYSGVDNLEHEVWKDIEGYEGLYKVSNFGRIKKLSTNHRVKIYTERILKISGKHNAYQIVMLTKDNKQKTHLFHRLMAQAFISNPNGLLQVNHLNGIKSDNRLENLEWCTASNNNKHAFATGLRKGTTLGKFGKDHATSKPVIRIAPDGKVIATYESARQAAKETGLFATGISACCRGINHKNKDGNTWRFANAN